MIYILLARRYMYVCVARMYHIVSHACMYIHVSDHMQVIIRMYALYVMYVRITKIFTVTLVSLCSQIAMTTSKVTGMHVHATYSYIYHIVGTIMLYDTCGMP